MRAVVFTGAGGNDVLSIEQRADLVPGPEEVVVMVSFAGLNPADILQREGRYPAPPGDPPDIPGLEVAGTVNACGPRVARWRPGDRVFGLVGGGGLAEQVIVHERLLAPVPESLDDETAAAVPEAFITAHDAIVTQAGLRMGETLLVHGAAGGVGNAAVQIGVAAGARVIATVRRAGAHDALRAQGAEVMDDSAFTTDGEGVAVKADVVLELVGAPHFPANVDALGLRGRIVIVGVGAGDEVTLSLGALMRQRATIRGTVLRSRPLEDKADAIRAFEREVLPSLARGSMKPLIDSVFPIDRVGEAFDHLAAPGKLGKVLLELR